MPTGTDIALLFPGQGSQTPDMRDHVARGCPDLLERVIELVGEDPFPRVDESTRFAQPAIFCASLAGWTARSTSTRMAAGHSLGELAALAAAGVLTLDDALRLVVLARPADGEASDGGTMLALLGGTPEDARARRPPRRHRRQRQRPRPGRALRRPRAARRGRGRRARGLRALPLDVAGAFHSPQMQGAVEPFRAALDEVELGTPRITVYSCATAAPFTDCAPSSTGR